MSSRLILESLEEEYKRFLNDFGEAICEKISRDEDVEALKEVESKEYLLEKVKEIIESVYQVKNEERLMKQQEKIEDQRVIIMEL
jgi:hypothetical protein